MKRATRQLLMPYAMALLFAAMALGFRCMLYPLLGASAPLLVLVGAIIVSAWYGGVGPGLLTTAICALVGAYIFVPPEWSLVVAETNDRVRVSLFVLQGILVSWLVGSRQAALMRALQEVTSRRDAEQALSMTRTQLNAITTRFDDSLSARTSQLIGTVSQLRETDRTERRAIATALHEDLAQTLTAASLHLASASLTDRTERDRLKDLDAAMARLTDAVDQLRVISDELSPPMLYDLGLKPALAWLCQMIEERDGLAIHFTDDKQPKRLDEDLAVAAFQAIRVALHHAARVADPASATLTMKRENATCVVDIQYAGEPIHGNHAAVPSSATALALLELRERLRTLGGEVEMGTSLENKQQSYLCIRLPLTTE